jgi:UDP-N-acetylmuramoyl-L-alanyl-D-glutamate--2,6-diaminopimelate ligase
VDSLVTAPPRPRHTPPKSFHALCEELGIQAPGGLDVSVTGVAINASSVAPGDVFVALPGTKHHGADFVAEAVSAGAIAVITDATGAAVAGASSVPVAVHDFPREVLGPLSAWVYRSDKQPPAVYAVTGTNGKTSVTFFLEDVWRRLGYTTALSNSTERRIGEETFRTRLTTPEANEIQAIVALAAEQDIDVLCVEASAQAIGRFRLTGLPVAVAGFTNLSHDHLNDYGDMDTYFAAKAPLFTSEFSARAVVCVDTTWGEALVRHADIPVTTVGAANGTAVADWTYRVISSDGEYTDVELVGQRTSLHTRVRALGAHMVQNAAVAVVMVMASGVTVDQLRQAVAPPNGHIGVVVPGRLEKVSGSSPVAVYIDAGRSADAYEKTLTTVRGLTTGKVFVVSGAAGNADPTKRGPMGQVAATLADHVIVTDDDPRFEDADQIRAGILAGARQPGLPAVVEEIPDPTEAVDRAVSSATPGDIIVWCGRGSQNYREIRGERFAFSARDIVHQTLIRHGYLGQEATND